MHGERVAGRSWPKNSGVLAAGRKRVYSNPAPPGHTGGPATLLTQGHRLRSVIYSTFKERPDLSHLLLGLVFVSWFLGMALLDSGVVPDRYDWALGSLLFATTLAWMGGAALAGATAPMSNMVMRYAYGVLAVFPLVFVAHAVALGFHYLRFDTDPDWFQLYSPPVAITLWAWMALAGLVGSLAPRDISTKAYISLVTTPLIIGICVVVYHTPYIQLPLPNWEGWNFIGFALLGFYGLAVFLLFRAFLSRLTRVDRLTSNLMFIPVAVFTVVMATLTLGFVLVAEGVLTLAMFGLMILLPFEMVQLRAKRSGQCKKRQKRHFRVAVAALGIAMASYWAIMIVAVAGDVFLLGGSSFGVIWLMPFMAGIVVSVPLGSLISGMRHPYRNVLVAAVGPGLLMLMIMCFYWFEVLDKGF